MLPQNCSDIHYSLSQEILENNKDLSILFNNICCFDYLINIEEYYKDNLMEIGFYKKFIRLVYELDKKNVFDFNNYNKESLIKFIKIMNKASCYFFTHKKIKYSKFLCNLSVKVCQILFDSENNNSSSINYSEKNGQFTNDLKNKNLISNIYNNACCNYLKTLSFNKCSKFLDYSYRNIEEKDIDNKLIYYNNLLVLSTKNIINHSNIENSRKLLEQLIQSKKEYFNNLYSGNSYYNNGVNSEMISTSLKENEENYKSFKLLCFVLYNYIIFIEKILNQKEQAKNLCRINYEFVSKFLGKSSFEAQKFLIRLKDEIKNKNLNLRFDEGSQIFEKNNINYKLNANNNKNIKHSDNDINLRLNNIIERIQEFEGILQNEKIINIINDKNSDKDNSIPNNNEKIKSNDNINIYINKEKENNIDIKINENNNNNPEIKEKEKITFDMMDNIIEEFKKESQEKLEENKKIKEEKEKIKKEKEKENENEFINEKERTNDRKNSYVENMNDNSSPRKAPRIKKLFQKVLGTTIKDPKKTKLGELFESLMTNKNEEKKEENNIAKLEDKNDEIKVQKEKENNFINLDDEDDDNKSNINDDENKEEKKDNENNQINQNCGFGFSIKINLDSTDYSYDATTLYQENET